MKMKQATGIFCSLMTLCSVLPCLRAAKVRSSNKNKDLPDDAVALAAEKQKLACSSHVCSDGFSPKTNFDNITGSATDGNCCNPTCRRWTCGKGFKSDASYASNVGASDEECCDKTCTVFQGCDEGTGVPESKMDVSGITKEVCCAPKCTSHSCIGEWTQDLSKSDVVADSDAECCQQSCTAVKCSADSGLISHPDRLDQAGKTTSYCCQKTCTYYASSCPANTGVLPEKLLQVVPAGSSTSDAVGQCCAAKCSGHTCAAGYVLKPGQLNEFVSKAFTGCCEKTCAAHTCSTGLKKAADKDNHTQPSDAACCDKTCELYACPSGWFNSTDSTKLSSVNRSNANCCEMSCAGYTCASGMTLRSSAGTIPRVGDAETTCCEAALCEDLRSKYTPTSAAQAGSSTEGADCNDFSGMDNCTTKYKMFNISGTITAVPCIVDPVLNICKMDDSRVVTGCSDL
eukprot:TRINITY_DN75732_c0_g1_i1.p1 TRINITY_DN75732_c0_g1~~TRINITY_DN75732_c0_g1_i1.p1  ORF type:complete len:457 (+),score=77.17 TRINITY_DN75732_c0_g1_i1:95-1465(+)